MHSDLDDKQRSIITSWFDRSRELSADSYASFIALWISFNAYCYALYAGKAQKRRADLKKDKGLDRLTTETATARATLLQESGRFKIEIDEPDKILIVVSERYTEDIIFSEFAKDFKARYENLIREQKFRGLVESFQQSLAKGDKFYVINMARIVDYQESGDYQEMVSKNVIVPFERVEDLKQLKNTLYQVRCNVFHGEKVPNDPNDDRIIKTAHPVLLGMMSHVLESLGWIERSNL